jgi:excisionase family DNA binding protein
MQSTEQLIDTNALASFLGYSQRTIYRFIEDKRIPFIRLGENGEYRFNKEEVLKALTAHDRL